MRHHSGFTLVESLITVSIVSVVVAVVVAATICTQRTFAGINHYLQLDCQSREAINQMARDIRQSVALTNSTSTSLSFTNLDGSLLQYVYDPNAQTLTYTNAGTQQGGTLLNYCAYCAFSLFRSAPVADSCMQLNSATAANCKVIEMNWICQNTNGAALNSAAMETSRFVIRN
jgi:prepilin-type N-terminal cleavage/methylation domain-containing protein